LAERAFISLGSNIEPERNLPLAAARLLPLGARPAASSVFQNPAIGPSRAPDFLNAVVALDTDLRAPSLRARLRELEAALGRMRTEDRYAPRTIDLDLILLGAEVSAAPGAPLPDPDLLTRAHLAVPMAELAPDMPHPVTGESMEAIAARLRVGAALRLRRDVTAALRRAILGPVDPMPDPGS
jgi:2-amino-4-hydroxy-6-hydroxymethyldihydropteridine diphosphokinase